MYAWWMGAVAGEYDITISNSEQPYTAPHNFFIPIMHSSPHTFSLQGLEDSGAFTAAIAEFTQIDEVASRFPQQH